MGNSPGNNVDPDGGCIWCETLEKALTLQEVTITIGKIGAYSSLFSTLLANSKEFINPIINSSLNTLSKAGSGISWFSKGLWNEGVMPTVNWVNHNINPVYGVFNGINSQFTHQDFLAGTPMTHTQGVMDAALPFFPLGKVGSIVEKGIFKEFDTVAAKTGVQYTKSSLALGREVHAGYKLAEHAPALGRFKSLQALKEYAPTL